MKKITIGFMLTIGALWLIAQPASISINDDVVNIRELTNVEVTTTNEYIPGENNLIEFTLSFTSPDLEFVDGFEMTFPRDVTPQETGTTSVEELPVTSVADGTIIWGDVSGGSGLGDLLPGTYNFTVSMDVGAGVSGPITIEFTLHGDEWGAPPHIIDGTVVVQELGTTVFYDLTMLEPIGEGSVTPVTGVHTYVADTEVNLNALPGLGYTFDNWNMFGKGINDLDAARTTITMDDNYTVQASFSEYGLDLLWHQYTYGTVANSSSIVDETTEYEVADNFSNPGIVGINKIVVYGLPQGYVPGVTHEFNVRFYDDATEPDWDNPVFEQTLDALVYFYEVLSWNAAFNVYKYEIDLPAKVNMQSGWVSVQSTEGVFFWLRSTQGQGDLNAWQRVQNPDKDPSDQLEHDMMLELWGTIDIATPPGCVTNISPVDEAEGVALSGTLSWNSGVLTTGYKLYFGQLGGSWDIENGTDLGNVTSYAFSGLDYETTYEWKVVPYNAIGDAVDCPVWTFTTMDDPVLTPPVLQDFEGTFPPLNWTRFSGMLVDPIELAPITWGWAQSINFANTPGHPNGKGAKVNIFGTTINRWLISPPINLGSRSNLQLEFDLALTDYNSNDPPALDGDDDQFAVIISTDGGETWSTVNILRLWDNAGSPHVYNEISQTGEKVVIDLSGYTGVVKFGFYGESTVSNADNDLHIDNFRVRTPPEVPEFNLSDTEWDFGTVGIGETSAPKTFTVSNLGVGNLLVEAPVFAKSSDFAINYDPGDFPANLGANENVQFNVVFSPGSAGIKTADINVNYNDGSNQSATIGVTGEGFQRPPGSTCDNPLVMPLPVVDYQDTTEAYGDDYSSTWVTPATSYLNGNDFVAQFTLSQPGLLTGSVDGSWTGLIIVEDCPNSTDPAERLALASGFAGGSFMDVFLEAGTYFAIVSTFPAPQSTDFTLNLSFEALDENPVFEISDEEWDFGIVGVGQQSAPKNFTITNTGLGDLVVQAPALAKDNDFIVNFDEADFPATLAINQTVSFNVVFAPTSGGAKTGSVNINYNDGSPQSTTVDLTGEGFVLPEVTFIVTDGVDPVEGANIAIPGQTPFVTDADGQASIALWDGEYTATVSKLGFETQAVDFTVTDADIDVPVELVPGYCYGGPTNTADSNVENVNVIGEDGSGITHDGGCPGVIGVEDLTGQIVDIMQGQTYTLFVTFGTCGGSYAGAGSVWIDWDNDFIFGPEDLLHESTGTPGTAPWDEAVEITFSVPFDAPTGLTVMRVMQREGFAVTLPLDPCAGFTWGSVMDFGINIIETDVEPEYYQVDFNVIGENGSLSAKVDGVDIDSGDLVQENKNVVFTATPDVGYQVKEWKLNGDVVPDKAAEAFTVNNLSENIEVTVEFEVITYVVNFAVVGLNGTLTASVDGEPISDGDLIENGKDVVFEALPDEEYRIKEWRVNGAVVPDHTANTYAVSDLSEDTNVTVEFEEIPIIYHVVTFEVVGENGTLTASVDDLPIDSGDEVREGKDALFTATPAAGFQVKEWKVNGVVVDEKTAETYLYADIDDDVFVTVEFEVLTFVITYHVVGENGSLSATVGGELIQSGDGVPQGSNVQFVAEPDEGYQVRNWRRNGVLVFGYIALTYNLNNVTANTTITVEFEPLPPDTYIVNFDVIGGNGTLMAIVGDVEISTGDEVEEGSDMLFTATPDEGYQVYEWTLNGDVVEDHTIETLLVEGLDDDITVTVEFEMIPPEMYTVLFNVIGNNGTLEATVDDDPITSGDEVEEGSDVLFTATPDEGYQVLEWTLNGDVVEDRAMHTLLVEGLDDDITVTVEFEMIPPEMYTVTFNVLGNNGTLAATVAGEPIATGEEVEEGSDVLFTATPDEGYKLLEWTLNGNVVGDHDANAFVVEGLSENVVVTVEFEEVEEEEPPVDLHIAIEEDVIVLDEDCFFTMGTIAVAGGDYVFTVKDGAAVTMAAGQKIRFLPGSSVESGGYLHAFISEEDPCGRPFARIEPPAPKDHITDIEVIDETDGSLFFKMYPNPTTDEINIELGRFDDGQMIRIEIISQLGSLVIAKDMPVQQLYTISLGDQQPGFYVVRIIQGNRVAVERLIKR